ncbi:MAG: hypothetical protein ACE5NA_10105, partial [Nitrospiraceae bacterium]
MREKPIATSHVPSSSQWMSGGILAGMLGYREKVGVHPDGWLDELDQIEASRGTVIPLGHQRPRNFSLKDKRLRK